MKIHHYCILALLSISSAMAQSSPKREFRGVWVASVANIDWPSRPGLSVQEQQSEFKTLLALHKANGMNAVIVQIRPSADAFYESRYEPWSRWLTGKLGQPPSPYYDPLKFMIEEAHSSGFEFHAWFNPYRAVVDVEKNGVDSTSVAFRNPNWFVKYGNNLYFNPGLPEARKHTINVIMEVVNRYAVDGIHFDDYFYPYKIKGVDFPDSVTYVERGKEFATRDDWRRNNVDLLIKELSDSIRSVKPHVQFGISPFGVWRNEAKDPSGSATKAGQTCYDDLYADVLKWQKEKWIDYVLPQIYWPIGFEVADYKIIAEWWNKNSYDIPTYIGQATYRIGAKNDARWNERQLPSQIRLNRTLPQISGSAYFSSKSFNSNPLGINDSLRNQLYRWKALPPEVRKTSLKQNRIYPLQFIGGSEGLKIIWNEVSNPASLNAHHRYVIYRFQKNKKIVLHPEAIIATLPALNNLTIQNFTDRAARPGKKYYYTITSLDIFNQESEAEFVYGIRNRKTGWKIFPNMKIE